MKKSIILLVGLLMLGAHALAAIFSFKFDGKGFIADGADVINSADREKIAFYQDYVKAQTSYSILVVTLETLDGVPASKVARVVSEYSADHEIGDDRDNILVFLVAPTEGKIGVEIGENLKSEISYITLKNIIQEEISPAFKDGDYSKAISDGIYSISRIIEPSLVFMDPSTNQKFESNSAPIKKTYNIEKKYVQGGLVGFFGFVFLFVRNMLRKSKPKRRRGGFGNHFGL